MRLQVYRPRYEEAASPELLQEGWEVKEVVEALDVLTKSNGQWSGDYEEFGYVVKQSSLRGRRRALNAATLAEVTELVRESPSPFHWRVISTLP